MFSVGLPGSPTSLGERATSEGGPDFLVRKADRAEWRIRRAKVLKTERAARAFALLAALVLLWSAPASAEPRSAADFKVPVEYYKLPNGLRVVLSPDRTWPTISVGVYYRMGFRIEPRDRTGFAAPVRTHDVPRVAKPGENGVHQAGRAEWRHPERLDALRLNQRGLRRN